MEYAVNQIYCVFAQGQYAMNMISIRKPENQVMNEEKTLTQRTEEEDPGSTYKTVMSKKVRR